MTEVKIKAGDHVFHEPTGETWLVATNEEAGFFFAAGWPETRAESTDCKLVYSATDEEHRKLLREVSSSEGSGMRELVARRQLAELESRDA